MYRIKRTNRRRFLNTTLLVAAALVGPLSGGVSAGIFDGGFLSGNKSVEVDDFEGRYYKTLDLDGNDYGDDVAFQQRELTVALTPEYGEFVSPALQNYVMEVTQNLIAAAEKLGIRNFKPRPVVYANPNPNALATPSGGILISHGLLQRLESEDQLAFVIGHEMAHALLRHHDKEWFVKSQQHTVAIGEVGFGLAKQASQATGTQIGGDADKWLVIGKGALFLSRDIISPAWNRNQEDQADLLGVDLMVEAGYQPREVLKVLTLLETLESAAGSSEEEQALARDAFGAWSGGLGGSTSSEGGGIFGQFSEDIDKGLTELDGGLNDLFGDAKRTHRDADIRGTLVGEYARREYRQVRTRADSGKFTSTIGKAGTKLIFDRYAAATQALKHLAGDKLSAAVKSAKASTAKPTKGHSYPQLVLSEALTANGDQKGAVVSLKAAIGGKKPALKSFLDLSSIYAVTGQHEAATKVAAEALERFEESGALAIHMIKLHVVAGRDKDAKLGALQCQVDFPELEDACSEALKGPQTG